MERVFRLVDSPLGWLTLVGEAGRLVGLFVDGQRYRPADAEFGVRVESGFESLVEQLGEYFVGRLTRFDVALGFGGTEFQNRVWRALVEIPYGQTVTYGGLAGLLGVPRASRAVGAANGRNRVSIVVPCHRVVGADGSLTGYAGGVERKRWLLDLESGRVPLGLEAVPLPRGSAVGVSGRRRSGGRRSDHGVSRASWRCVPIASRRRRWCCVVRGG